MLEVTQLIPVVFLRGDVDRDRIRHFEVIDTKEVVVV